MKGVLYFAELELKKYEVRKWEFSTILDLAGLGFGQNKGLLNLLTNLEWSFLKFKECAYSFVWEWLNNFIFTIWLLEEKPTTTKMAEQFSYQLASAILIVFAVLNSIQSKNGVSASLQQRGELWIFEFGFHTECPHCEIGHLNSVNVLTVKLGDWN